MSSQARASKEVPRVRAPESAGSIPTMRAKLVIVQGRPRGKRLVFPTGDYYFGRGAECQVRPNSAMISRQHCLLRVHATGATLRDLGSRNGTLVNGVLISKEQRLKT